MHTSDYVWNYGAKVARIMLHIHGKRLNLEREARFLRDSEAAGLWPHVTAALIVRYGSKVQP